MKLTPNEYSHGLGTQREPAQNKKWPISDDLG